MKPEPNLQLYSTLPLTSSNYRPTSIILVEHAILTYGNSFLRNTNLYIDNSNVYNLSSVKCKSIVMNSTSKLCTVITYISL